MAPGAHALQNAWWSVLCLSHAGGNDDRRSIELRTVRETVAEAKRTVLVRKTGA